MLRTALTEMFGLQHPIILGPMGGVAGGALAAAVSNAGGLGMVGGGYGDPAWLRTELSKVKLATQRNCSAASACFGPAQLRPEPAGGTMTERLSAWQCIGCGRIEGAQPCVGICQDRKTEFVYATDYDAVLAQLEIARRQADDLAALVRQLAHTTPRRDEWERTYRALQAKARRALTLAAEDTRS